jgi:membrane protein DedA with SNARE-associated domain
MDLFNFNLLLDWLYQHSNWLGLIIGLTAFFESLLLMGLLLPGVVMLFAFSSIAGALKLNVAIILIWGFAGAVLGDSVSFWIGRKFKNDIYKVKIFAKNPFWLKNGIKFFEKYGALSIALGRFIGPIRPFIPTVAGILGMRVVQFYTVNIASSIPWAFAYILPGYYSGSLLEKFSLGIFGDVIVTMLSLVLLCAVISWIITEFIFMCKNLLPSNLKQWLLGLSLTLVAIFVKYFYHNQYIELNSWLISRDNYEDFILFAFSYYKYILYIMGLLILYMDWRLLKGANFISVTSYMLFPLSCCLLICQMLYLHPDLKIWTIIQQNYIFSFMLQSLISCMLLLLVSISTADNKIIKTPSWKIKILYIITLIAVLFATILSTGLGLLKIDDILVNILLGMIYAQTIKLVIK